MGAPSLAVGVLWIRRHLPRMQADPNAQALALRGEGPLHVERGFAGQQGVTFQRPGRAKDGHDTVAQCSYDCSVKFLDRGAHARQGRAQAIHGLLGIQVGDLLRGAHDIGEKDGGLFEFAPCHARLGGGNAWGGAGVGSPARTTKPRRRAGLLAAMAANLRQARSTPLTEPVSVGVNSQA
ncbi:MAG: hypothetical protein Q8Q74_08675 [Polaromonas sp.]|nr:hypothetical protein [Polaromonas sp.]